MGTVSLPNGGSPQDHDRLNGWKEIAAFLGKGVRTAQRWERQYGLPIHRLGHEGGEIVFALKSEIDRWSLAQDGRGAAAEIEPDDGRNHVPADPPPAARASRWRWPAVAALVVAAAVGGWLIARALPARPGQPASWKVEGDTLHVFDDRGAELWSHHFEGLLNPAGYTQKVRLHGERVSIQDLDGDGRSEVLFGLFPLDLRSRTTQGLVCFESDGTVRFTIEPDTTVRFGTTTYSGPWVFDRLFLSRAPDGAVRVWAVFIHGMEFPSAVLELDDRGAVRSSYWSDGFVGFVSPTRWRGRDIVLVGAINNETRGGSLAIFEGAHVHGSAPSAQVEYRCTSCEAGGPDDFLVFPRRDIAREAGDVAEVRDAWTDEESRLHVLVSEDALNLPGAPPAGVWYWFTPSLTLDRVEVLPELLRAHLQMEEAGLLNHPFGAQDENDLFPVLRWNGKSYDALPRAPVTR